MKYRFQIVLQLSNRLQIHLSEHDTQTLFTYKVHHAYRHRWKLQCERKHLSFSLQLNQSPVIRTKGSVKQTHTWH